MKSLKNWSSSGGGTGISGNIAWLDRGPGPRYSTVMENVHAARRLALMERIGPRAVAVVGGKKPTLRNGDVENRFRASSDLWFLTGFTEPEALAVIAPGREKKLTMFVRPRDPERETWTGRRHGLEGAQQKF